MANNNDDMAEFTAQDAINYIKVNLPDDLQGKLSDDQIQYILDLEDDYYESKGFFDEKNNVEDIEVDEIETFEYVFSRVREDERDKELDDYTVDTILHLDYDFYDEQEDYDDDPRYKQ